MRGRFSRRNKPKEDMVLQITSMADIFTIILVFLLKSLSMGLSTITPNSVILPEARTQDEVTEALKVEIGESGILIDSKPVTSLRNFAFDANDLESDGTPRSLNAVLIAQIETEKQKLLKAQKTPGERDLASVPAEPPAPHLIVMADEKTPYETLKTVLTSAANSGFGDFKLLVVQDE